MMRPMSQGGPPTRNESTQDDGSDPGDFEHDGKLEVWLDDGHGAEKPWRFGGDMFSVGSHPSNELVLPDPAVSRFHCEIRRETDILSVRDLNSRNGTFVDGVRIREAILRGGSVVRVGRIALRFGVPPAAPRTKVSETRSFGDLVGDSDIMRSVFSMLELAAQSQSTVLLEGETGTGKGEAALGIHNGGARKGAPFIVVDGGAVPGNLFESELFGHERGAFTGAHSQRIGAFEAAQGGTIFLDEIGELPIDVQPKLLRALEERQVRRLGSTVMRPIDVRVIAATNRDLRAAVNDGTFRADLFYRLAVVRIHMPSVRERAQDLPLLVAKLLESLGATAEQRATLLAPDLVATMRRNPWRGNVRELRNYLERSLVLEDQAMPRDALESASAYSPGADSGAKLPPFQEARSRVMTTFERQYLETLMKDHDGKVATAADTAGLSRVYLYRLLSKYGMSR